jgi:hypothetical protein
VASGFLRLEKNTFVHGMGSPFTILALTPEADAGHL